MPPAGGAPHPSLLVRTTNGFQLVARFDARERIRVAERFEGLGEPRARSYPGPVSRGSIELLVAGDRRDAVRFHVQLDIMSCKTADQSQDKSMANERAAVDRASRDARGVERGDARDHVREDVDRVLSQWRKG